MNLCYGGVQEGHSLLDFLLEPGLQCWVRLALLWAVIGILVIGEAGFHPGLASFRSGRRVFLRVSLRVVEAVQEDCLQPSGGLFLTGVLALVEFLGEGVLSAVQVGFGQQVSCPVGGPDVLVRLFLGCEFECQGSFQDDGFALVVDAGLEG